MKTILAGERQSLLPGEAHRQDLHRKRSKRPTRQAATKSVVHLNGITWHARDGGEIFIAVAGNMAVGKTTFTERWAAVQRWLLLHEAVDDNPWMDKFYTDMRTWSFHAQTFFLARRVAQHRQALAHPGPVVQDRTVYEDIGIFARNLYIQGLMSKDEWDCYSELAEALTQSLRPPDLVIYLKASVPTLMQRVGERGRNYERSIKPSYLEQLNTLYEEWAAKFDLCPMLTVDTNNIDFVQNPAHFDQIAQSILEALQEASLLMPAEKARQRNTQRQAV